MRTMFPFKFVLYLNKFLVKKILLSHEAFQIIFSHNVMFLVCCKSSKNPEVRENIRNI